MSEAGVLTTLVSFQGTNGGGPVAGLALGKDGNFYGSCCGEEGVVGTIFRMTPAGALTTLTYFNYLNGEGPEGTLIQGSAGDFYGTTRSGGAMGYGTVFRIAPSGILTTLFSFDNTDGNYPQGKLIEDSSGRLYGTTTGGGTNGVGVVFTLAPPFAAAPPLQNQTIDFPPIPNHIIYASPIWLDASASSGVPVSYSVAGPATLTGNILTLTGLGPVSVIARAGGDANYRPALNVEQKFIAIKATQTITFAALANGHTGFYTLTATASSGLPVTYTVKGPATVSGNQLTVTGLGTVAVTASQPGNASFSAAPNVQQKFAAISPPPLTGFISPE